MPCPTHHIPGPKPHPTSDYILGVWGHGPGHSDPNLKPEATNHLTSGHGSFLGYTHRPTGALLAILSLAPLVLTVDASDTLASPLMTLYDFHIFIIKVTNKTMHSSPSHYQHGQNSNSCRTWFRSVFAIVNPPQLPKWDSAFNGTVPREPALFMGSSLGPRSLP